MAQKLKLEVAQDTSPSQRGKGSEGPRKQEIINTAAKLFKEKGYNAVTMRDLAAAMGIKAASLYNHIHSKQDILNIIVISIAEEFTHGMQVIITSKKTNISKLKAIVSLHVNLATNNTNAMAALNNDWMHLKDQLEYYLQMRTDYENNVMQIITNGISENEIKETNPEIVMFSMLTTLRSLYLWLPKKEVLNPSEFAENLSDILINGFNK